MSLVLQPFLPFPHSCQGPSPHQQGRDTKMADLCRGIDVASDRLDVMLLPHSQCFWVDNNAAAVVAVMRKMITTLNAMLRDGVNWQPQAA